MKTYNILYRSFVTRTAANPVKTFVWVQVQKV